MCFVCMQQQMASGTHPNHISSNANSTSAAFTSSNSAISALTEGLSWTGTTGIATSIAYTFGNSVEGGNLFDSSAQNAAMQAMQAWANVANITFTESSGGELTFSQANLGFGVAGLASTFFFGSSIISSEVQIDDEYNSANFGPGGFEYLILLHEIGHALGLKHPGNYGPSDSGPFLSSSEDTVQTTVMSYNNSSVVGQTSNPPTTPMYYDIAAMQFLYGANTSYNSGNSSYNFTGANDTQTIWDGGGTDTIDGSAHSGNSVINLSDDIGSYSTIGSANIWIAEGANIESGITGSGNDTLLGNNLTNFLFANNGFDTLYGYDGNDTLNGGKQADQLYGGSGADVLGGGQGLDTIYGGNGQDTIYGGLGNDVIYGEVGADLIYGAGVNSGPQDLDDQIFGGNGADTIISSNGNDTVNGNAGNDSIIGGRGNDEIRGGSGTDTLRGASDNDTIFGGNDSDYFAFDDNDGNDVISDFSGAGANIAGDDVILLSSNINGSGITTAADAIAATTFSGGSAIINVGAGHSITILNITSLIEEDFSIL